MRVGSRIHAVKNIFLFNSGTSLRLKNTQNETQIKRFALFFDTRQTVTKVVPQLTLRRSEKQICFNSIN